MLSRLKIPLLENKSRPTQLAIICAFLAGSYLAVNWLEPLWNQLGAYFVHVWIKFCQLCNYDAFMMQFVGSLLV